MAIIQRQARNLSFTEVKDALNGTGSWWGPGGQGAIADGKTALDHGDTLILPTGGVTWDSTATPAEFITCNKDISIMGSGQRLEYAGTMDEANAIPNANNVTIITCKGPKAFAFTYQGTPNVCRFSSIVFELTAVGASVYLLSFLGKCYRRRVGSDVLGGLRIDHIRVRNSVDPVVATATPAGADQVLTDPGTTTFNVLDTSGFRTSGTLRIAAWARAANPGLGIPANNGEPIFVTYNGKTATSFLNVTGSTKHIQERTTVVEAVATKLVSGPYTFPINGVTITVASTVGFVQTGGSITIDTTTGSGPVDYQSISGNTFVGCSSRPNNDGATISPGADVSQGTDPVGTDAGVFGIGGGQSGSASNVFISGSFDHNFMDYKFGTDGSEIHNFAAGGSPNNEAGNGWGQYMWTTPYTYGGGDDSDLNVLYFEDNIIHRPDVGLDTLQGGLRQVARYNTSWGGLGSHGIDGGNAGPVSKEVHNNWIDITMMGKPRGCTNTRGGTCLFWNNRFLTSTEDISGQTYRAQSTQSQMLGPATGRNFNDNNFRGNIQPIDNVNPVAGVGRSYNELHPPEDAGTGNPRLGSIYAEGTDCVKSGNSWTLIPQLDGQDATNTANRWAGFTIINKARATDPTLGEQGTTAFVTKNSFWGTIMTSTNSANSAITVATGANFPPFNLVAGQAWEIRRVKQYLLEPGSGILPKPPSGARNGDINTATPTETQGFYYTQTQNGKNKYWCGQVGFGLWQKYNKVKNRPIQTTGNFALTDGVWLGNLGCNPGGANNLALPPYCKNDLSDNDGNHVFETIKARTLNATTGRIGAHWQAPGIGPRTGAPFSEGQNYQETLAGDSGATVALGHVYPNPMVSGINPPTEPVFTSADHAEQLNNTAMTPLEITTSGFSGSVTITKTGINNFPSGVSIVLSGGKYFIQGTPTGGAVNYPNINIHATDGVSSKDQLFTYKVYTAPTVSVSNPTAGSTVNQPATVSLEVSAAASATSSLATIDYYRGGSTLIASIDATEAIAPYAYSWTGMASATYSITAKATDNFGTVTTSSAVSFTVQEPPANLAAPTIIVTA